MFMIQFMQQKMHANSSFHLFSMKLVQQST